MDQHPEHAEPRAPDQPVAAAAPHAAANDAANNSGESVPGLAKLLGEEWKAIRRRRRVVGFGSTSGEETSHPSDVFGIALSGGGIRSATFALGVLQGLRERRLIGRLDYLSTVSGGGFTGGWWSAWLSRTERGTPADGSGDEAVFPPHEQNETSRYPRRLVGDTKTKSQSSWRTTADAVPEGSLSVREGDPVHHLRLFANYLTPRTGILSADTWRAITVIARNLVLTWLALLPVLFTAVLLMQLYFAASQEHGLAFICSLPDRVRTDSVLTRTRSSQAAGVISSTIRPTTGKPRNLAVGDTSATVCKNAFSTVSSATHAEVLRARASGLLAPLGSMFAVSVILSLLWMLSTDSGTRLTSAGVVVLLGGGIGLIYAFVAAHEGGSGGFWSSFFVQAATRVWLSIAGAFVLVVIGHIVSRRRSSPPIQPDGLRNLIVRYHSKVNVALALAAVMLVIGGFGHEIAWWFSDAQRGPIARAGGWSAILASIGTALYTSLRAAPSPKEEPTDRPNIVSRAVFAVAPILVLAVLAVLLAWLGNWLMRFGSTAAFANAIGRVVVIGVGYEIALAINEFWERRSTDEKARNLGVLAAWIVAAAAIAGAGAWFIVQRHSDRRVALFGVAAAIALLVFRLITTREQAHGMGEVPLRPRFIAEPPGDDDAAFAKQQRWLVPIGIGLFVVTVAVVLVSHTLLTGPKTITAVDGPSTFFLAGSLFVAIVVVLELALGVGDSDRAVGLAAVATASCAALLVLGLAEPGWPQTAFARAGYGLVASALALVIALGWAIDPNLVSLHTFYRARLVRAYLGASNRANRKDHNITESAPDDDMKLSKVRNHELGGPYHLINTTLNLAGGRDLATAQRSAENFVLSSIHCGSGRTGYRKTTEYMSDSMMLGMAVAISGAAVSPNMGSATPSAALAMLLSLFNVRIGFWAPTPDRRRYRERRPRLWPVYLLRESLSQTNDLGTYCYLTDGGHFDNTALYALIERGCKTIIVVDDGADPKACFGDMGQALRRCRIDFGTEISLEVDQFRPLKDPNDTDPRAHLIEGTIEYSAPHLKQLGYDTAEKQQAARLGKIYWIKPVVRSNDSVDVRQYKLQNGDFPQQTTADQWFDEAQFESYRKLGMLSGTATAELIMR